MTDLDALFRAILAHPDDDTARLVYADALEDVGRSKQAAFIRGQVELARVPDYDPVAVRWQHHDRAAFDGVWLLGLLPDLPEGLQWAREPFRRGFPAAVQARDGAAFVDADRMFEVAPIECLELSVVRMSDATPLSRYPWLARLTRLSLPTGVGQSIARRLLNSPYLERLTELEIGSGLTSPQTAAAVARSQAFRRLRVLSYRDEPRGGAMITELARLTNPPRLKKLDLGGNRITAERAARLVAAPAVEAVEDLDLSDNNLGPEGVQVLAAARLPFLRSLHLMRVRLGGPAGVLYLAEGEFVPNLRALSLGGNNLGPEVGPVIAAAPLGNLRVLDLTDNRLGDAGATALAGSPHLANLVHLDLAENGIGDRGADALAESPHLGGLTVLNVYGNKLSPGAMKRLEARFGDRVFL